MGCRRYAEEYRWELPPIRDCRAMGGGQRLLAEVVPEEAHCAQRLYRMSKKKM
jgi:hypothetical protein